MGSIDASGLELPCLEGLEEWERRKIMMVLQRDLDIQKQKDLQIHRLRAEIEKLREPPDETSPEKRCLRCKTPLGLLLNSGAPCPNCRARVCVSCRIQTEGYRLGWVCVLCDKRRQYAVLTGEWVHPNSAQTRRSRSLTKSKPAIALRIRNPNTENDYFPAAAAAKTEPSVSGILLHQLREGSLNSWRPVDTAGFPPKTNRNSEVKRVSDEAADPGNGADGRRPRSPSLNASYGRSCRRQGKNVAAASGYREMKREASYPDAWPSSRDVCATYSNSVNPVPVLRVDHIEDETAWGPAVRTSWRTTMEQRSLLNAFTRGSRCPSVPYQLDAQQKNDSSLASLLSVHNVRVSVRSTSSDNVTSAVIGSPRPGRRERSGGSCRSKQHSANDVFVGEAAEGKGQILAGDKKYSEMMNAEPRRPVSQSSNATTNDVSGSWDNISVSDESVASLSSCSIGSSVKKCSLKRVKGESSASLNSSYSSKITVQGEILLSCNYNCVDGSLEVHVVRCRNLYQMSTRKNHSNPYIKMYLLPDTSPLGKRKTRVRRHTVNPMYDEILKFNGLTKSEVESRTLLITAWHCDVLNRSHFLGEIHLKLSDYSWIPGESYWVPFGPRVSVDVEPEREIVVPDMMVSVKFSCPNAGVRRSVNTVPGSLHCLIRCPQNLLCFRVAAGTACYIKCYLYPDHRKLTKQKSPITKLGADPAWTHTFLYDDLTMDDLRERCLELTVWAHQRVGANEFLGGIRLNIGTGYSDGEKVDWMDSSEEEAFVWKEMLAKPNVWVDATIPLRVDMESKL